MARPLGEAPGLHWKLRDGRRIPRWEARRSAVKSGYRPAVIQLDISPEDFEAIKLRCRAEQARMEAWLAAEIRKPPVYVGTIESLIELYATDAESPYRDLKYSTQLSYEDDLKILRRTVGKKRIDKLSGQDFRRWFNNYKMPRAVGQSERLRRAHGIMTMLRILITYGASIGLPCCKELKDVLSDMRFKQPRAREQFISYQQAVTFIAKAHEMGFPEMALGQALQFEGTLRQIDITGEWAPDPEIPSRKRWTTGLVWQDVRDYVLSKRTSKTGQNAAIDFKEYPLALAELAKVPAERRVGPVILDSKTGQPFRGAQYSRRWRLIANAANIPQNIWNRDSRAGGITEGSDAGADLEHLRHHASHSAVATTARYDRKTLTKTRRVARLRVAYRQEL